MRGPVNPAWPVRLPLLAAAVFVSAHLQPAAQIPLGPLGGTGQPVPGTGMVEVLTVTAGGPGATAGVQPGDFLRGADGREFGVTSTDTGTGYLGAIQDLAQALDRAEGNGGTLTLQVVRSGVGGLNLPVNVGTAGSFGPAWPAGSAKAQSIYDWCCAQVHSKVQSSSDANFGYNSGWFGVILLSHPSWNDTAGTKPYRNSINKLRTRCEAYLNGRVLQPAEAYYWNGSDVVANPAYSDPGLENWDVCSSAVFLALYRTKSGDLTVDAVVQRAAEMIAHRVQHWVQYDDPGAPHVLGGGIGRMGHGGVHGDYSHYDGTGALNIINAHALPALALLKAAGANMQTNLGPSINAFTYNPGLAQPTIEQKFRICWDYVKAATTTSGGDEGNVGYVGKQSGWDSAARTPGCFAGWHLYGMTPTADDTDKAARQAAYFVRYWYRQQHAHAYTLGGVVLSQLAMPFLDDRPERFFQENTSLYPALARQPDGTVAYFPGRQNNGGDGYLNLTNVGIVNAAMPLAVRSGNLPGFPAPDPARIHAWMRSPANSWPALAARRATPPAGLSHALDVDVTDADGNLLAPAGYTAAWAHVSGPGTAVFGAPNSADTTVSFPQAGTYRIQLTVTRGAYTLVEPYDFMVVTEPPPAGVAPYVVGQPAAQSAEQGATATFTVTAQGTAPLLYQWRRNGVNVGGPSTEPQFTIASVAAGSAGDYDCVITNAHGTATSDTATLTVNGVGSFHWGGLWRDVFTGISGSSVADLTGAASFPGFPDASGAIPNAESPSSYAENYGQRWSGWITPPETGNYRFYIATDDNAELWISTDDRRANRVRRARETSYRGERDWPSSTTDESTSPQLALVAGRRYYIELLHKEGGGGDNAAVTWNWQSPGVWATPTDGTTPLPGAILEYQLGGTLDDQAHPPANYPPLAHPQALVVYGGAATALVLTGEDFENSPLSYQVVAGPAKGQLAGTPPTLTYTPNPGASGTDRFTFKANDGGQDSLEAAVTVSLVPESAADLKVWTGATDNLWTTAGNWLSNSIPDSNDAVIFNASSAANLSTTLSGNKSVARLVIENPAGPVTIAADTLTLSKGLEMRPASQDLTISSAVTVSAAQEWSVGDGRMLAVSGALGGAAALTKTGGGLLSVQAVGTLSGGITVNEGTMELRGGGWYAGNVGGSGMVTINAGATAVNVNAHSFGSSEAPSRDLTVNGGRFRLQSETYADDVWLTAGTIDNVPGHSGDFRTRSGSGSVITVRAAAAASVIACPLSLVGTSTILTEDGAAVPDLLVSGPLASGGALTKDGRGRLQLSATCTHTGAVNVILGELAVTGTLAAASSVTVQGGSSLCGTGHLQGAVTNRGQLAPGLDGRAVLTLGSLSQSATGVTTVELGGTTPGIGHDQLAVTGTATLAGALDVLLAPGYLPQAGDSFTVLTCGARNGAFETINLPALPPDRAWVTSYDPGGSPGLALAVVAVPPFQQWQQASFGGNAGNPAIAGPTADPDRDKIPNLLEYALNLNPNQGPPANAAASHAGLPVVEQSGNTLALVYRRNLAATDTTYQVEDSADLGTADPWSPAAVSESVVSDDGHTRVVRATLLGNPGDRAFLRLRVTR